MTKFVQRIMIVGFCLLMGLPLAATLVKVGTLTSPEFRKVEMRQREGFPQWDKVDSVSGWTNQFGRWFNDRYAFRHMLSKAHALIQYRVFHQSAFPGSVVVGKNDFLFLGDDHASILSVHAGLPVWPDETLAMVAEKLRSAADWLGTGNIPLLISIAPDKPTIYGENLPGWIREPNTNLPVARLLELAKAQGQKHVHYNPQVLLEAKTRYPDASLYMSGDTHWNPLGAFVYYQDIMRRLETLYGKPLRILPEPAYTSKRIWGAHEIETGLPLQDLEGFLKNRQERELVEVDDGQWPPVPEKRVVEPSIVQTVPAEGFAGFVAVNPHALNPQKILLLGDSFSKFMSGYFYRSFESVLYLHSNSSSAVIAEAVKWFEPDMVVFEVVERSAISQFQGR